jgi:hypothetical protein
MTPDWFLAFRSTVLTLPVYSLTRADLRGSGVLELVDRHVLLELVQATEIALRQTAAPPVSTPSPPPPTGAQTLAALLSEGRRAEVVHAPPMTLTAAPSEAIAAPLVETPEPMPPGLLVPPDPAGRPPTDAVLAHARLAGFSVLPLVEVTSDPNAGHQLASWRFKERPLVLSDGEGLVLLAADGAIDPREATITAAAWDPWQPQKVQYLEVRRTNPDGRPWKATVGMTRNPLSLQDASPESLARPSNVR